VKPHEIQTAIISSVLFLFMVGGLQTVPKAGGFHLWVKTFLGWWSSSTSKLYHTHLFFFTSSDCGQLNCTV